MIRDLLQELDARAGAWFDCGRLMSDDIVIGDEMSFQLTCTGVGVVDEFEMFQCAFELRRAFGQLMKALYVSAAAFFRL